MSWGFWGLHQAGANGDLPPLKFEPFDTMWSNGIMARHAHDDRPVGHLHWHPDGEIDSITVHPDLQRRGIGTAMLKHAQDNPHIYESSYPVRHSSHFSAAGRAWAQSDPDYHDPGDQNVTKADDDVSNWGYTAMGEEGYTPLHVPYTGQNEERMKSNLTPGFHDMADPERGRNGVVGDRVADLRRAAIDGAWPKQWRGKQPSGVAWDKRWSPNHPQHDPVTAPWQNA
ncbi:hypothetical protein KHO57_gp084 [Mycobacterium phage Phabba]|uniref:N-acetyltransferase domain-containing protein n=1 Tax=Mycobacterium phage Phabba TaxID=2027899 RepID=A0A249XSE4_9CAUD|nr:hypothetical protein KHO57_gp084 [Mycobacterium phage Phabba]ASZ74659.1 hypothetical protein SEA_PHABBA_84 [Mycobacterium phage Phabba]